HGIQGGLVNAVDNQKLAVESGYILLMRYFNDKLYLDSPIPDFKKYDEFLNSQLRYRVLSLKDTELSKKLLKENQEAAAQRYNYYKEMSEK
ncbi:MAG: hypothetical protein PHF21_04260, partial [Bacilli bacterium]|nr:hypothetical protein [Bacilli bacterium]